MSTRTLVGYRIRQGNVRGKGRYWSPGFRWSNSCRDAINFSLSEPWLVDATARSIDGRRVRVYRRIVIRREIEDETAKRIADFVRSCWSNEYVAKSIERGGWRKR